MREILFRGKRPNGMWAYGYLAEESVIQYEAVKMTPALLEQVWVDPETVGQYTGLNDKSGMKIFEGDILLLKDSLYKVFWNSAECSFKVLSRASDVITIEEGLDSFSVKSCTIVGNIYDNPGLLEVDNV